MARLAGAWLIWALVAFCAAHEAPYQARRIKIAPGVDGIFYKPEEPLQDPPPLVIMLPALGQPAAALGLRRHAHAFAASGLATLVASGAGAPLSPPDLGGAPPHTNFAPILHARAPAPADISPAARRRYWRAAAAAARVLGAAREADINRVAWWGAEWGALPAVEAALEAPTGTVKTVIVQVRTDKGRSFCWGRACGKPRSLRL
jgi:hypothetical protein